MPQPNVESVGYTALIPKENGYFRFGYSASESKMIRYVAGRFGNEMLGRAHIVSAVRMDSGRVFVVDKSALRLLRGGK